MARLFPLNLPEALRLNALEKAESTSMKHEIVRYPSPNMTRKIYNGSSLVGKILDEWVELMFPAGIVEADKDRRHKNSYWRALWKISGSEQVPGLHST